MFMGLLVSFYIPPICIPTTPHWFSVSCKSQVYLFGIPQAPAGDDVHVHLQHACDEWDNSILSPLSCSAAAATRQHLHEAASHLHNNQNMARFLEDELKEQTEMSKRDFEGLLFLCSVACVYTPASTRWSAGRKLPRCWDTPDRRSRQQQRDGHRGDKRQPRPCWCSSGRQLSTHLSAGRTCMHTTHTRVWPHAEQPPLLHPHS